MRTRGGMWTTLLVLACAAALVAGCGTSGDEPAKTGSASGEPIKIGAIVSLSGTYAGLGTPEKQAIELQMKALNEAGGVAGRPVEVIFEDDATDPAKATAALAKLIDKDQVVAVIGATGTGQTMAMRNDVKRAGITQVSMAGGSVITDELDPLVFQTPWPNRVVVPFTIKNMKDSGIKKIGILSDSGGYGTDGLAITLKEAEAAGIEVVAQETFNAGDTDMTTQLTKIKSANPQAIQMWSAGKEAAIIAKNLRQIDPQSTIALYGTPGNGRTEFIEGAGEAAEGFTFSAGKILMPEAYGKDTEAYKIATGFIDSYTKAYGKAPDIFAGHAYDAFLVLVDALKRTNGDTDPVKLRDAVEKTNGLIGMGGTFNYSATDHNGLTDKDLVMYRIKGGKWELVP